MLDAFLIPWYKDVIQKCTSQYQLLQEDVAEAFGELFLGDQAHRHRPAPFPSKLQF